MGLFGFIGKAVKGIGKVVGTAAKVAGGLGIIPGGGLIGKAAGILLAQKQPMGTTNTKYSIRSPVVMRGNSTQGGYGHVAAKLWANRPPPAILRASPVLPGGAYATPSGVAARSAFPPAAYPGMGAAQPAKRRRKRKATTTRRRRSTSRTRKRGGRKLKFGSPAWRKKYLGHGRKKRRKAA